jgi:hypothetical protein
MKRMGFHNRRVFEELLSLTRSGERSACFDEFLPEV